MSQGNFSRGECVIRGFMKGKNGRIVNCSVKGHDRGSPVSPSRSREVRGQWSVQGSCKLKRVSLRGLLKVKVHVDLRCFVGTVRG